MGFCDHGNELPDFQKRQQMSRPIQLLFVLQRHDSTSNRNNLSKSIIHCDISQREELLAFCQTLRQEDYHLHVARSWLLTNSMLSTIPEGRLLGPKVEEEAPDCIKKQIIFNATGREFRQREYKIDSCLY